MLNQAITLERVRMPVIAIVAFALGALASAAAPQLHLFAPTPATPTVTSQPTSVTQPIVTSSVRVTSTSVCDRGAYVSGDMVGDASPASVHATMCGR